MDGLLQITSTKNADGKIEKYEKTERYFNGPEQWNLTQNIPLS
jgi:hypothetical protein